MTTPTMTRPDSPTIISFYAGAQYYHDAAARLRDDCEALGLRHSIVELELPEDVDWGQICRRKIPFYLDRIEKLDSPILWVDVDSRIRRPPDVLTGCRFDLVGYARHNRYIRDYDRYYTARFWMPSVIYFNNTPRALRYLRYLAKIERESTVAGSDDYFMQEAWKSFDEPMSVGFMPPCTLAMNEQQVNEETIVVFRASGNASTFVRTMEQHTPAYKTPTLRKLVFEAAAADANRDGDREECAAMYARAFRIDRADKSIAFKLAEVLRLMDRFDEAVDVLKTCQAHNHDDHEPTQRLIEFYIQHGDSSQAHAQLESLLNSADPSAREYARSHPSRANLNRIALKTAAAKASLGGGRDTAAALYRRVFSADESDKEIAFKLAETLRLLRRFDDAVDVLRTCQASNPDDHEPTKRLVNYHLQHGDFPAARASLDFLSNSDNPASRDFAESRRFRLDLDERAREMRARKTQRTPMWWMEGPYPGNFGDILNPYLVEKITGIPPSFAPRGQGLLAIGSIIKFAKAGTRVWGSGTPRMTDRLAAEAEYCAVRGPLTRRLVLESGGSCPEVYGDPALLLPRFYQPAAAGVSCGLGLIPHISHLGADKRVSDQVRVISPKRVGYAAIESFVDAIAGCRAILTSSLHGLIVANAYGVPARWCTFGEKAPALAGDGTKFLDYFLSVGMPEQDPLDLSQVGVIDESLARHVDQCVDLAFDDEALLAAFPFEAHASLGEIA